MPQHSQPVWFGPWNFLWDLPNSETSKNQSQNLDLPSRPQEKNSPKGLQVRSKIKHHLKQNQENTFVLAKAVSQKAPSGFSEARACMTFRKVSALEKARLVTFIGKKTKKKEKRQEKQQGFALVLPRNIVVLYFFCLYRSFPMRHNT